MNTNTSDLQSHLSENKTKMRTVKSFVRRQGHMSAGQHDSLLGNWQKYGVGNCPIKISPESVNGKDLLNPEFNSKDIFNFSGMFDRQAPVVLEIGFGDGASLAEMARCAPELNFLGIEVYDIGVAKLLGAINNFELNNIKIMSADAIEVLNNNISDNSLSGVNLFFPDPWPKSRHHKRRLVQLDFLELIAKKMMPQSNFYAATDWQDYANHMLDTFESSPFFKNEHGNNNFSPRLETRIITKFEQKAKDVGRDIYDLCFRRI